MKGFLRYIFYLFIFVVLTLLTQIGGVVFFCSLLFFKHRKSYRLLTFIVLYIIATFIIVPYVAPVFGREKIKTSENVKVHMFLTSLLNRNYVKPQLNIVLGHIAKEMAKTNSDFEIHTLDANFPFFDGFPLLPHLSHNDGKKLDISLLYKDGNGLVTNDKPSISGYGKFEDPRNGEYNQIEVCKNKGYWQYDFPKYLTLGVTNDNLKFDSVRTKELVNRILKSPKISKVFIEPHLKTRMGIANIKVRYHGCQAVRHDDHIHIQMH